MPSNYVLAEERLVRYVPASKLRTDEDLNVIGTLPAAFLLRPGEEYLSVTWCEYFSGSDDESFRCAAEAMRASYKPGPNGRFAVAAAGAIKEHMKAGGCRVRIVHESEPDNPAHAAIRGWPSDDLDLLDSLAEHVWFTTLSKSDVDLLPTCQCTVSPRGACHPSA